MTRSMNPVSEPNGAVRMNDRPTMSARRTHRGVLVALFVAALTVGALGAGTLLPALGSAATPRATLPSLPGLGAPASSHVAPLAGPPNSSLGAGTFFSTQAIPLPPVPVRTCAVAAPSTGCPAGDLLNVTNEVTMNLTSRHVVALAYTALTNDSPCAAVRNYSQTNIGFTISGNNGTTWSTPKYLGNPDCASAGTYPSAWQPSITSLSNGTLVLAYIQYNVSSGMFPPIVPYVNPSAAPISRLVLTESYDNGTSWTSPQVLNVSNPDPSLVGIAFPPLRPSVAAWGNTIYLSWMSLGSPYTFPGTYSLVSLLVSTNGGSAWSPVIPLGSPYTNSINPNVMVAPNGTLYIAYATDVYSYCYGCGGSAYVVVARSAHNGTQFTTNYISYTSPTNTMPNGNVFLNPAPQLAYDKQVNVLDLAFVGGSFMCGPSGCGDYAVPMLFISTNNASSWFEQYGLTNAFSWASQTSPYESNTSQALDVALAVAPNHNLEVEVNYLNGSLCLGNLCGIQDEIVLNSSNNGTTWSSPWVVSGAATPQGSVGGTPPSWSGEYESVLAFGPHLLFGWVSNTCPSYTTSPCGTYPNGPQGLAQVQVSEYETSGTHTVTFTASGLPSAVTWSVSLLGNYRTANGTTNLTVSSVSTGVPLLWSVVTPIDFNSTAHFAVTSQGPLSGSTFTANATVYENYSEYVPLTVSVSPAYLGQPYCSSGWPYACTTHFGEGVFQIYGPNEPYCAAGYIYPGSFVDIYQMTCVNLNVTPVNPDGQEWVEVGVPTPLNVSYWDPVKTLCQNFNGYSAFCEVNDVNVSFLSWQGSGAGSVTSTSMNISVTPQASPLTETLSVYVTGGCAGYYDRYQQTVYETPTCTSGKTPLSFQEHGLPLNTPWSVTVSNGTNPAALGWTESTSSSTTSELTFSYFNFSEVSYNVWDIPAPGTGDYWVATSDAPSTLDLPYFGPVILNFSLVSLSGTPFAVNVSQQGLMAGTSWTYSFVNSSASVDLTGTVSSSFTNLYVDAGWTYTVNSSPVYNSNGTSYYLASVDVTPFTENATTVTGIAAPASVPVTGSVSVVLHYAAEFWLSIGGAGVGGSITPSSEWVASGQAVTLTATPSAGYVLIGWSGLGNGSSGSALVHQRSITIHPTAPVTETATFAPAPPPTWKVTVVGTGIPGDQNFSITLGGSTYTGAGTFTVANLSTAAYSVSVPYAYATPVPNLRWMASAITSSFTTTAGGDLNIDVNGTITVTFAQQDLLTVVSTAGGTVTPSPGMTWQNDGSTVSLTATQSAGYKFLSWNGTGPGAQSSTATTISVTLSGAVTETAAFAQLPPPPPPTYTVTVEETNLPVGVAWNATVGSSGAAGSNASLSIAGLSPGTYNLSVGVVYGAPGVRYYPNVTAESTNLAGNLTVSVSFATQYEVTIAATGGGTVSNEGSQWVASGGTFTATATAASGYSFAGWTGTQTSTGASLSVTVSAPLTETASFTPVYPPASQGSSTSGMTTAIGLFVVLLAAGLAVGLLLARRRRAPPAPVAEYQAPGDEAPVESVAAPAEPYDEGTGGSA